ncbi:MAG: pantetheine-phosphate adenylyltransferase [bacterium]
MKKRRSAVYPGSFDPITNGHVDIIRRAEILFDEVIIAVLVKPSKKTFFRTPERISLIKNSLRELDLERIKVISFSGLLVNYMKEAGSEIIVRGLRAVSDFDYEFQMALMNRKLSGSVETVFLMTDAKFSYLSSSIVREIAGMGGDISALVPGCVARKMRGLIK